ASRRARGEPSGVLAAAAANSRAAKARKRGDGFMAPTLSPARAKSSTFPGRSGPAPGAPAVETDRDDDHRALDHQLPEIREVEQGQPIGQDGDDQGAVQRPEDGADAAGEAGAAQDHRRDGVE